MRFKTLVDVQATIQNIERANHRVLGHWTAAQNFYHLAAAFEASLDGLPDGFPLVARKLIRPIRWFITRIRFPPSVPIPESIRHRLEPPFDVEFDTQKVRLLESIDQFREFSGTHPPHPVLGPLTRDEWVGFHLRHSQHHLSFIKIKPHS